MARLEDLDPNSQAVLRKMECPVFDTEPFAAGPPVSRRRVAIVSTAGLHRATDRPFMLASGTGPSQTRPSDYRVIPSNTKAAELVMSHTSTNFDRAGFQQDWNVVFPLDRLHELAGEQVIGSVASFHYSFMGATDPRLMEPAARRLASLLRRDHVDAVILVPV